MSESVLNFLEEKNLPEVTKKKHTYLMMDGHDQEDIYVFLLIYNRVVDKMKVVYPFYESVIIKKPKKVNV